MLKACMSQGNMPRHEVLKEQAKGTGGQMNKACVLQDDVPRHRVSKDHAEGAGCRRSRPKVRGAEGAGQRYRVPKKQIKGRG